MTRYEYLIESGLEYERLAAEAESKSLKAMFLRIANEWYSKARNMTIEQASEIVGEEQNERFERA